TRVALLERLGFGDLADADILRAVPAGRAHHADPAGCRRVVTTSPVSISCLNRRRSCASRVAGSLPVSVAMTPPTRPPAGPYRSKTRTAVPRPRASGSKRPEPA